MFQKNMKLAYLLDFYSEVLDEHTRAIMNAYYSDDLSLAEIAELEGISRQGVRHIIKKGEEQLEFFEKRLALAARYDALCAAADSLRLVRGKVAKSDDAELSHCSAVIDEVIDVMLNKGV